MGEAGAWRPFFTAPAPVMSSGDPALSDALGRSALLSSLLSQPQLSVPDLASSFPSSGPHVEIALDPLPSSQLNQFAVETEACKDDMESLVLSASPIPAEGIDVSTCQFFCAARQCTSSTAASYRSFAALMDHVNKDHNITPSTNIFRYFRIICGVDGCRRSFSGLDQIPRHRFSSHTRWEAERTAAVKAEFLDNSSAVVNSSSDIIPTRARYEELCHVQDLRARLDTRKHSRADNASGVLDVEAEDEDPQGPAQQIRAVQAKTPIRRPNAVKSGGGAAVATVDLVAPLMVSSPSLKTIKASGVKAVKATPPKSVKKESSFEKDTTMVCDVQLSGGPMHPKTGSKSLSPVTF